MSDPERRRAPGRYVRIIGISWRTAVATELEYRLNFVTGVVLSTFWMVWAGVGAAVFFQFAGDLAGWTYPELLVVIGLFFAMNGVYQAVLQPNVEAMTEHVRRGTLDFLLLKPVDAQLLVSLRHLNVANLLDPFLGLALAAVGVVASGHAVSPGDAGAFVLLLGAALLLLYGLVVVLMATAVWLVGAEEAGSLFWGFLELSRFPVDLYRDPLRTILTVIPVALLTTLPAQAVLGRLEPLALAAAPSAAVAVVLGATLLWRRALRGYTGASA